MANSPTTNGQLQRSGVKRLITDRKGKQREALKPFFQKRKMKASKIRESNHHFFTEQGADEKNKEGKKNRVYLVTIIEEGLGNSKDKNYYSAEALQSGVTVFNGAKAYADHPDAITEKTLPERSMKDLVGWYSDCFVDKNPKTGKTRLRGKLHFFPSAKWLTDMIDTILTDASAKNLFGISINAVGKTRPGNMDGQEVNYVEEFQRVDSADVVTEPAARGKFDKMLESRRAVAGRHSRKVSSSMRTRESGTLSPEKQKQIADSLVSAGQSDNPDELKQAANDAAKELYAAASISGKGPGQANEEQYSNINPSPSEGGSDAMKASKRRTRASAGAGNGNRRMLRKGKRLVAAAGTGPDNEDEGEPNPEDIEGNLEESDVEDEESRSDIGEQGDFGGGSKYRSVKASGVVGNRRRRAAEALEDEGLEGLEDEGMEDEDGGMAAGGGGAPGAGSGAMGAPAGGGTPGSSRTVASAEAKDDDEDDDMDDDDEMDGDTDDMDESDVDEENVVAESRPARRGRRFSREADGSAQGPTVKKASYAGGLGHSGHTALPKGADPSRGYEDSDEDFGKEDSSTSGTGKSYKIKTSRFARNQREARIVHEANRRIGMLSETVRQLRESNSQKEDRLEMYKGKLRQVESGRNAKVLLREAVSRELLDKDQAKFILPNLLGKSHEAQVRAISEHVRFIESASRGVRTRLTESAEGSARGGFVFRESAGAGSDIVTGLADYVPMKSDE